MTVTIKKFTVCSRLAAALSAGLFVSSLHAATVWTGPNVAWTKSGSTPTDTVVPGKIVLRRSSSGPLYNTAAGETSARSGSPKGITFAIGDIKDFATLSYQTLDSMRRKPHLANAILNQPMVAHIADGDIYFPIKFTSWGMHGQGSVSYVRATAAPVPPIVTLTSPSEGAAFTAPATINLSANATGGTITGVSFYSGSELLGTVATAPYNLTVNNVSAGSYSLAAVATTADAAATSGVVHITVTAPLTDIALSAPAVANGAFTFSYSADLGQTYVIQGASALTLSGAFDWTPLATNTASRAFGTFSEDITANHFRFFRVGRVPAP